MSLSCFKAYDIRGRLGVDLDEGIAYRIGRAFGAGRARVIVGYDARLSSPALADAVVSGLMAAGVEVLELGLSGTEEMYWAVTQFGTDGGICVTASHNPADYNGMKLVDAGSAPIADLSGLQVMALSGFGPAQSGSRRGIAAEARAAWAGRVLSFIDMQALRPLRVLVDAGNGAAGPAFDVLAKGLENTPLQFIRIRHEPDGQFPHGIPNPLLQENRPFTAQAVRDAGADLGVAWDGDFDRCFLYDANGNFVDGEYTVGLLADVCLRREPQGTIIHDPRVVWNTQDVVARAGGHAVAARTGHAFMKRAMRDHDAVYGGEMSAHHYFRDFAFCDSGMIPWLMVVELMSRTGMPLADLVAQRRAAFPSSGEINFRVADVTAAVDRVTAAYQGQRDDTDGLSMDMGSWRFNLRASNTEPLLRLNVESRGDAALVAAQVARISALVAG
ncbi:phosphomannomutase/phosphoglucomutase [Falsirhodobacter sp. alg1]|uniref:phosphomannomutase/phosphoglucomutase n=1 Tax=Falsirhodobacter sp. alg1 TaxID=1472418 RepID=UPI0005EFC3B6|nr:phosphomannomutase/phosphoglucomutase [Falsirhodobacter sp. alg1]